MKLVVNPKCTPEQLKEWSINMHRTYDAQIIESTDTAENQTLGAIIHCDDGCWQITPLQLFVPLSVKRGE